ncbi:hypothetical protein [Rhizobium sp. ZX09]|uniref:hypothetical protein n=1 Tax=Rhizobium sp. ZX09 TaxID=2291939 RepID=UPI001FEEC64D|nr:hypothetical protein [Rhizobium sp. ZX09]
MWMCPPASFHAHARIENAAFEKSAQAEGNGGSLPPRIERFTATRISTPELTLSQSVATTEQKTVYNNLILSEIAGGRIARYSIDKGSYDIKMQLPDSDGAMKDKHVAVSTGVIAGQDIDVAYLARLYTEKAGPDDKEAKPLYGPLSVKTVSFIDGDGRFSYDEIRSDGFTARMPSEPLLDTLKALTVPRIPTSSAGGTPSAFCQGRVHPRHDRQEQHAAHRLKADAPDEKEGAAGKRVKAAIDRIDMQMDSRKLDFGLNGLSIGDGDGKIEVAEASLKGFDWSSTIEGISQIIALDETEIETFQFNRLIPELGRVRVGGINVDIAAPKEPEEEAAGTPERIRFTLKNFEMGLTKPFNGIPTDIEIRQDDLTLPIPADATEDVFVEARKLGLETLAFSYGLSAGWDEPNSNLVIRDISLSSRISAASIFPDWSAALRRSSSPSTSIARRRRFSGLPAVR